MLKTRQTSRKVRPRYKCTQPWQQDSLTMVMKGIHWRETKWGARHLSKGIGNDKQRAVTDVLPLSVSIPYSMTPGKAVSLPCIGSPASNHSVKKHHRYATFGSWAILGMVSVLSEYTHFIFLLASLGLILVKPFYIVEGEGHLHFGKSLQCGCWYCFLWQCVFDLPQPEKGIGNNLTLPRAMLLAGQMSYRGWEQPY